MQQKRKMGHRMFSLSCIYSMETSIRSFLCLGILQILINSAKTQEVLKASQCFKSRGIPKVQFECNQDEMIKINKAFHGIALANRNNNGGVMDVNPLPGVDTPQSTSTCMPNLGQEFANCSYCEGDCVDDSMNLVYDWSTCMGNTTCERTVMQSYMPACVGRDKFSDYLQVEYQCIPRSNVIDICSETTMWINEGYIMSPNYPEHYPINADCSCRIQTDWNSKLVLSFYDLLLETKQVAGFSGRCRADWLMLRQKKQKHRHCGAIMTGTKNITSEDNVITLQFHTDENDNRTQNFQYFSRRLKGFWLYFKAEPEASFQVVCRKLQESDPDVQEIYSDDADYNEVISTKGSLVTSDPESTTPILDKSDKDIEKENKEIEQDTKGEETDIEIGKENDVDAQSDKNYASNLHLSVLRTLFKLSIVSTILYLIP